MPHYICIHAHFYQPPRENAWSQALERQPSAAPYHDWNERICVECYRPNTAARRLDEAGRILQIQSTYPWISFNFGPTLLAWLERAAPEVYAAIRQADLDSRLNFGGHGSALAQPFHHTILPLDEPRDIATQIAWGIRDFQLRFSRDPEGIWLPETAVSLPVLDAVAAAGLRFTVLAPGQAVRWRDAPGSTFHEGAPDGSRAARVRMPSGREIAVFFYDGALSRAVAFDGLLRDGSALARSLASRFDTGDSRPQLAHIATDGETYGHHHRFGEMALLAAIDQIRHNATSARLTNYGEFLALHPPEVEVEIAEFTSWSCAHGVERWRGDCGCNSGGFPHWHQRWRGPLRDSLAWLRDRITPEFAQAAPFDSPWQARDAYGEVVIRGTSQARDNFLARHARAANDQQRSAALQWMELQHNLLRMFTSCAWFFDDVSGIETLQILQYAARALQLAKALLGLDLSQEFLQRLAHASSNIAALGDGRNIFETKVLPARWQLPEVLAHQAAMVLFEVAEEEIHAILPGFDIQWHERAADSVAGGLRLCGTARVGLAATRRYEMLSVAALCQGRLCAVAVRAADRNEAPAVYPADMAEVRAWSAFHFDVAELRADARGAIAQALAMHLDRMGQGSMADLPPLRIYARLAQEANTLPEPLRAARWLTAALLAALCVRPVPLTDLQFVLEAARQFGVGLGGATQSAAWEDALRQAANAALQCATPGTLATWTQLSSLAAESGCEIDKWAQQNCFWRLAPDLPTALRASRVVGELAANLGFNRAILATDPPGEKTNAAYPNG